MEEITNMLDKNNIKYNYDNIDEVVAVGALELCLTTKNNIAIFNDTKYMSTVSKEHAIKILNLN